MFFSCNNYGILDIMENTSTGKQGYLVFPSYLINTGLLSFHGNCTIGTALEKANCSCDQIASSKGFKNFGNKFVAWLSHMNTVDAICNIQGQWGTTCSGNVEKGPVLSMDDGQCFGDSCRNNFKLLSGSINDLLQKGATNSIFSPSNTSPDLVWTGTSMQGRATGLDCTGWTVNSAILATTGEGRRSGQGWTDTGTNPQCSASATYYCFEIIQ